MAPGSAPDEGTASVNPRSPDRKSLEHLLWNNLLKGPDALVQPSFPASIVTCTTAGDVQAAVKYCIDRGLRVLPRAGGHHYGGVFAQRGALLLDLSPMQAISVDPAACTARIQPGVTAAQLYDALDPHRLHWPGPHLSSVTCSGFTLGGGNGFGTPALGAACDAVLSFEAVEGGRGELVRVSAESDPDLFWGLRGAGPFLAVVTEFELQLSPMPAHMPCSVSKFAMEHAADVLLAWGRRLPQLPRSFESPAMLCTGPDGQRCAMLINQVYEQDSEAVRELLRATGSLAAPAHPLSHQQQLEPFREGLRAVDPTYSYPGIALYGQVLNFKHGDLDEQLVGLLLKQFEKVTSPRTVILLAPGMPGGYDPCAAGFRGGIIIGVYSCWERTPSGAKADGDERHILWAKETLALLKPTSWGAYLCETMFTADSGDRASDCYEPQDFERLRRLKDKADPHGVFRTLD